MFPFGAIIVFPYTFFFLNSYFFIVCVQDIKFLFALLIYEDREVPQIKEYGEINIGDS